jgi:arylsulfatase A-like enzyme
MCLIGASWILTMALGGCKGEADLDPMLASGSASGFDVVLITLDTTRADHLGSYGYAAAETPNLDRLAREGIRFTDAVSPAPLTLPSHASILTGLDPQNHGVRQNGQFRLDPSRVTLAEVLKVNGYETAAFVSGFVLDSRYGLSQGFDLYDGETEPFPGQPFGGLGERSAEAVTDRALSWLGSREGTRPFFLWVHYYDPHAEYKPPEPFAGRFENPYDGEIAFMDSQIGRLVAELQKGRTRLLVIAAGDHGESLGEHSEYAHSRLIYETTQHVPLFLWSPSIAKPRVVDGAVVGLVDIFPTVVDLLGIRSAEDLDGISLRQAGENRDRALYIETMAPYLDNGWAPLHGLRRHRDKYILAPKPEYYDLAADPGELKNLYVKAKTASDPLAEELRARLKDTPSAEAIARDAAAPDPETLRRLQALGYLSGPGPAAAAGSELPDPKDMIPIQRILIESRTFRREGRLEEALAKASEARKVAPKDLEVLEENGLVFIEMNRLEEAEEALRAYTALKPNPNILILLAEILAETGRRSEGETLLQQAMELEPDHGGVMITWGDFLAARGKYDEAMSWYQKAKEVDPYRATAVADRRIVELRKRASGS